MAPRDPDTAAKPPPPHETRRAVDLPGCAPKPGAEDLAAPEMVRRIMASPSYRRADEDMGFLHRDGMRGTRLMLDFQKPETLLEEHGIAHAIVVFGGTRIGEEAHAAAKVAAAEAALAAAPCDPALRQRLEAARRLEAKCGHYRTAREFGRLVGQKEGRHGNRLVVVTGGGPGIMEAANRGAHDAGARNAGFNITLPREQFPNPYVTPELCFSFRYFAMRKLHFLMRARALVVFPGGYGTLDELFETLTLIQTRKIRPVPVVLVGRAFWERAVDFDFLAEEGVIDPEDRALFWHAETAQEIWDDIERWHERAGRPLAGAPSCCAGEDRP